MELGWLLFGFNGRINRETYCLMALIYVAAVILGVIGVVAGQGLGEPDSGPLSPQRQMLILGIIIVVFISALAGGAKRLHDRDKSAWWLLLFYVVPIVLLGIGIAVDIASDIAAHCLFASFSGRTCPTSWTAVALCLIALAIGIWTFAELCCLPGTIGTNRYGRDPLSTQDPEGAECGDGNGR